MKYYSIKNILKPILNVVVFSALMLSTSSMAIESGVVLKDTVYYQIGGYRASRAPTSYTSSITIGGSANISSNLSCGNFDLENNLKLLFENISNGADRAIDALVFAAQSALAELPFYILRRADPNLANMLENAMARYEDYIKLSIRSCKEAHRMIMDGENPYADWVKVATAGAWKEGSDEAEADSEKTVTDKYEQILDGEGLCVRWVNNEKRACEDGAPIEVVKEVTERGHELTTAGSGSTNGAIGSEDARLQTVFPSADDASAWLVRVLGDMTIDNTKGASPSGTPGYGVGFSMSELAQTYIIALTEAVGGNAIDAPGNETLSIPGIQINATMIRALKRQPADMRGILIAKIGTEMAMLQTMEKINIARDLLMTGSRDPYVINTPAFKSVNSVYLPQLKAEYELIKDQYEIKDYVAKSTMTKIVTDYTQQLRIIPSSTGRDKTTGRIESGGFLNE